MKCSRFQSEYESGKDLQSVGLTHLEGCDRCRRFVAEEKSLSSLLASLPDVSAPGDFGASVASRIASIRDNSSPFWATARIAVPVAAMLLIVGFVVVNSSLFVSRDTDVSPVAKVVEPGKDAGNQSASDQAVKQIAGPADIAKEKISAGQTESPDDTPPETERRLTKDVRRPVKSIESKDTTGIRSIDMASEEPDVTNPEGLNPDKAVEQTPQVPEKPFSVQEVLRALGVDAEWTGENLFVGNVAESGIGYRSGVRTGDQIRSIDGRRVSKGTIGKGRLSGKVMIVRRGGNNITINIRSN